MPMSGRFRSSSIPFPIHMLAISPQKRSGLEVITCGPGTMPWIIIAPSMSAIEVLPARHEAADLAFEDRLRHLRARKVAYDLGQTEDTHRHHRDADTVGQLRHAEGEALHARIDIGADDADEQPRDHHRKRLEQR